jgi:hypothetical protein
MAIGASIDWGGVTDFQKGWQNLVFGSSTCGDRPTPHPSSLFEMNYVHDNYYTALGTAERTKSADAYRTLYLLKHSHACLQLSSSQGCPFNRSEVANLTQAFVTKELAFFETWSWENHGLGFDLGSYEPFRFWCLLLDNFADTVPRATLSNIHSQMSSRIDRFLQHFETQHWALFNGNNWSVL